MLERLEDPPDLFEMGELTLGMSPPRNICNCCSLIEPSRLCMSPVARPPKSAPNADARPAAAELTPPRSPVLAEELEDPGGGGLFKKSFNFRQSFSSFSFSVSGSFKLNA